MEFVRIDGAHFVDPAVLQDLMTTQPGKPFDHDVLHRDLTRIYGRGDFEPVRRAALT